MWISRRPQSLGGPRRALVPLGPLVVRIAAPPETVFDVVAAPYLGVTPRAMADKLRVIDRGETLVVADHFTPIFGQRLFATTRETVAFERPARVSFRLLSGPVAGVEEDYLLEPADGGTRFTYRGALWSNLLIGASVWARLNARTWNDVVRHSLSDIAAEAERKAALR